ncbi:MAG TPA: 3-deoxy-7-phosphoheptulonate synthase, partial [Bacteroidota bacterium]|nr:3-deoxy-7-phosphoheptulonate synthase [Bacteroidota bacterium]
MIIVMRPGASQGEIEHVFAEVRSLGYGVHPIYGEQRTVIACVGDERGKSRLQALEVVPGVESVIPILKPYKLASTEWKRERTTIRLGKNGTGVTIGNSHFVVMAGPCSVETREQILTVAASVRDAGANVLRGGAFKPRSSPYSFQGLEEEGL